MKKLHHIIFAELKETTRNKLADQLWEACKNKAEHDYPSNMIGYINQANFDYEYYKKQCSLHSILTFVREWGQA